MEEDIELEQGSRPNPGHPCSLAPVDGGRAAWRLLLSAFVFESLLWGFPLSFGVFQNYYSQHTFKDQRYVSVIGTAASGISYMGAPFIIPMLSKVARYRSCMIWCGWMMCIVGILASSFAKNVPTLIFTQGIMYGVGFTIFYYPIIGMVNEYWIARRGMAYGILCSSSGVSGAFMPSTIDALLNRYGHQITLRAMAVALALLTGPLIPTLKSRLPQNSEPGGRSWTFLTPLFWFYTVSNLTQGLGFFFPSLFLPSYASMIGSPHGAILLSVMSISQILGQFSFGYLSDRKLSINLLTLTSTIISAIAIFVVWGLAKTFAALCAFALVYGFFGAGYSAMWARMGTAVAGVDTTAAFAAFGCFNFGKGVGNVLTGPISANLLTDTVRVGNYAIHKYEAIVLFAGSCMAASALSIIASYARFLSVGNKFRTNQQVEVGRITRPAQSQ